MKNNKKWFSIIIVMWLIIISSLLVFSILEYIIPFSREVRWIENATLSFYQWNSWIEDWLYQIYKRNSWSDDNRDEKTNSYNDTVLKSSWVFETKSSWSIIPPAWEWTSFYDSDWNTIYQTNPIQLNIWEGFLDTNYGFKIFFRVPDINWSNNLDWLDIAIINWQLSSSSDTLNSGDSYITASKINNKNSLVNLNLRYFNLKDNLFEWKKLDWSPQLFKDFYNAKCNSDKCVLRFSIVNKLINTSSNTIPYLEWKVDIWNRKIPLMYTRLYSSWKSFWYKKDINIRVPFKRLSEAFDFTVFQ